jgi:DNA mismatch repair protein MutL
MSPIRILSENLKNKIAAGEVVERPASVVKELVENALDAGATVIDVEAERGGRKLIRVSDNGSGMDREDALLCIRRHATSKLSSEEDLFSIRTLGFRGEALPSIASVSEMTLTTAPRGAASGVLIEVRAGEATSTRESPSEGTAVEVRDLFFNTPARKKFLKRDATELVHIVDIVTRAALVNPRVGFSLMSDGRETMNTPRASGLRERLAQIYGVEFLEGLVELGRETDDIKIEAFVSHPKRLRDTRAHQFIFVNGRPVRDPSVSHAVYSAYDGLASKDRHPVYFLFIELEPSRVDFNVHPAKREVRFQDKDVVYRLIKRCVNEALGLMRTPGGLEDAEEGHAAPVKYEGIVHSNRSAPVGAAETLALEYRAELPFVYLGETFVAVAGGDELMLVDYHAAHERVLYERLLGDLRLESRQLLFPRQVKLSPKEHMLVLGHRDILLELGIELEDFGQDTVVVRSVPEVMDESELRGILSDVADEMKAGAGAGRSLKEAVAARIACHGSLRGRMVPGGTELAVLLDDLSRTTDPGHCPHGRPTRISFSHDDLKKMFKRK